MDETIKQQIADQKVRLIEEILALVEPHFWASGYVDHNERGESAPLKLYAFKETQAIDGHEIHGVDGFTKEGVIYPAAYGGCVINPYKDLPIEDLFMIKALAEKLLTIPNLRGES